MANHHVLDSHGADISGEDTWQALATAQLPDGIALSSLTLLELLHKQEKVDVLVPLADLLNADGKLANGLLAQVLDILKQHSSRLGVWITSNTDADDLPDVKDFLLTQDLIVIHVPSFADGRGFVLHRPCVSLVMKVIFVWQARLVVIKLLICCALVLLALYSMSMMLNLILAKPSLP